MQGVVRLNKQLAYLQLHGYPVPIRFIREEMGPYSRSVRTRAVRAGSKNLLRVRSTDKGPGLNPRFDVALTPDGEQYAESQIFPSVQRLPHGKLFLEIFTKVGLGLQYEKDQSMVDGLHKILHMNEDDPTEFATAYWETRKSLEAWHKRIEDEWRLKGPLNLTAAAAVDLGVSALDAVRSAVEEDSDNSVGKHNILWNCERLVKLLDMKESGGAVRQLDQPLLRRFERALVALEVNAEVYEILHLPTDEEVEAWLEEAAPLDPTKAM